MMTVYTRNNDGTLSQINVVCLRDEPGVINIGTTYNPTRLNKSGTTTLLGWGTDDGDADVYATDAGREVIVPERYAATVAGHLCA